MGVRLPSGSGDQPVLRRERGLLGQYAWYRELERRGVAGGQFEAERFGLFDMLGNVYEWCQERSLDYTRQDRELSEDCGGYEDR